MRMAESTADSPASLQVFRYIAGDDCVRAVIGDMGSDLPQQELVAGDLSLGRVFAQRL